MSHKYHTQYSSLFGYVFEMAKADNTGVANGDVEMAEMCNGIIKELNGLRYLTDVCLECHCIRTVCSDSCDDLFCMFPCIGIVDDDFSAQ
jgi:hypothetical protein